MLRVPIRTRTKRTGFWVLKVDEMDRSMLGDTPHLRPSMVLGVREFMYSYRVL